MAYLRKLNCSSGAVLQLQAVNTETYAYKNVLSIPYKSKFSQEFSEVYRLIPNNTDHSAIDDFIQRLPVKKSFSRENHFYVMNLADFGLLCLKKNGAELEQDILFTLQSLNKKLAQSSIACIRNQDLINAKENAEESDRLKTAFIENISHEIRTPLNAIIGYSSLIGDNQISERMLAPACRSIVHSSNNLLALIEDLLDVSLLESGNLKPKYNLCNINQLIQEQEAAFMKHCSKEQKKKILFKIDTPFDDMFVVTDSVRLNQIFDYLISNAVRFTEEGEIQVGYLKREKLKRNSHPVNLTFYVKDTGIGIPEHKQHEIFKPFNRITDSKDKLYSGTGIGLTIAQHLIKLLEGEIWIESEPCIGSIFYFSIPAIRSVDELTSNL
jgi:signal transduction histidine kinase